MKKIVFAALGCTALFLASCETASQKVSGNYNGTYSSNGLTNNTGSGMAAVVTDGDKVDITFASSGNVDIHINDVSVTAIVNTYILDVPSSSGASLSSSVVGNMLSIAYTDSLYSLSFNGSK